MSAPMSMEEWQSRLRQQKQVERQNAKESEENLHKFRRTDLSEEERLTKIRLEQQQKARDAAQLLHNYRAKGDEVGAARKSNDNTKGTMGVHGGNIPPPVVAPGKDNPADSIASGSVSSMAASFAGGGSVAPNTSTTVNSAVDPEVTTGPPKQAHSPDSDRDWVKVNSAEEEELSSSRSNNHDDVPLRGHPTLVRLDVDFSFGLISRADRPVVDSYMMAVENVVRGTIEKDREMKEHVRFDPAYLPFVQETERDETYVDSVGRTNIHRFLVKAAVPVFLTNGISPKHARVGIIRGLQEALRSGNFFTLAAS